MSFIQAVFAVAAVVIVLFIGAVLTESKGEAAQVLGACIMGGLVLLLIAWGVWFQFRPTKATVTLTNQDPASCVTVPESLD